MNILRFNEPKLYNNDEPINTVQHRQKEPHRTTQRELTNTIQHGQN